MFSPGTQINGKVTGKGICTSGCNSSAVKQQVGIKGVEINELWLKRKISQGKLNALKSKDTYHFQKSPPPALVKAWPLTQGN